MGTTYRCDFCDRELLRGILDPIPIAVCGRMFYLCGEKICELEFMSAREDDIWEAVRTEVKRRVEARRQQKPGP